LHPFCSLQLTLFYCNSPQNALRSTFIDVNLSLLYANHSLWFHPSNSNTQDAIQQCRCAPCARGRRGGSGSSSVCLVLRLWSHAMMFNSVTNHGCTVLSFNNRFSWSSRLRYPRIPSAMRSLRPRLSLPRWLLLLLPETHLRGTKLFPLM
jgi:hypothetical protein